MFWGDRGQQIRFWDPFQVLRNSPNVDIWTLWFLVKPNPVKNSHDAFVWSLGCPWNLLSQGIQTRQTMNTMKTRWPLVSKCFKSCWTFFSLLSSFAEIWNWLFTDSYYLGLQCARDIRSIRTTFLWNKITMLLRAHKGGKYINLVSTL